MTLDLIEFLMQDNSLLLFTFNWIISGPENTSATFHMFLFVYQTLVCNTDIFLFYRSIIYATVKVAETKLLTDEVVDV